MAGRSLTEIRLLAASPGDVESEREEGVRRVVDELNNGLAGNKALFIRMVTWKNVPPELGRVESVILDWIGQFDIFVGIMGQRFGTPTGRFGSGTQEEFEEAYAKWQATQQPRVMFYFKQNLETMPTKEGLKQLSRVLRFREKVQSLGLTYDYHDHDEFIELFRRHLTDVVLRWETAAPNAEPAVEANRTALIPFWEVWDDAFRQERKSGERLEAWIYRTAETSIKFMTISGRSIYSGGIEESLKERARTGLKVKILLFDWNSPWICAKMQDERRETPVEIQMARERARNIARQLLLLASLPQLAIEVRLYDEYPVWRFVVVDEQRCYLGYYPKGKKGYEGPLFIFDRDGQASLFHPVNQYFDLLWRRAGANLRLDDPRFDLLPLEELDREA